MESRRHRSGGAVPLFAPAQGGFGGEKGHPSGSEARLAGGVLRISEQRRRWGFMCEAMGRVG